MNGKRFMRSMLLVVAFMMVFSLAAFADTTEVVEEEVTVEATEEEVTEEEVTEEADPLEALVTVVLNDTYEITVDGEGTVYDVVMIGEVLDDSVTYEFGEDGTAAEVAPPHPYESYLGTNVVSVIEGLNDPVVEDYEVVVTSDSEEVVEAITAMINGEEVVEELGENPNAERFAMAKALGITPGKMNILERLAALSNNFDYSTWTETSMSDIQFDYSAWADTSMRDIQSEIRKNKKDIGSFRFGDVDEIEEGIEEVELEEVEEDETEEEKPAKENKVKKIKSQGKGKKK